jgi:ketosteroid isomerase-like protein
MLHAVLACEEARRLAMLAGDADSLVSLFSDELQYVHSSGATDTKASLLGKLRSGQLRYLRLEFHELDAREQAGIATVSGRMSATVLRDGLKREVASRFVTAWQRTRAGWQMCSYVGTPTCAESNLPTIHSKQKQEADTG